MMNYVVSSCTTTTSTATTSLICASLQSNNNNNSPNLPPSVHIPSNGKHKIRNNATLNSQKNQKKQPSVAEMERAIGAGMFRDRDTSGSGEKQTLFDLLSSTPLSLPESELEKKLRETGEWVLDVTEGGPSRSAGHEILMVICLRILPVWLLFLLVASGTIKLPFTTPALDDFIM